MTPDAEARGTHYVYRCYAANHLLLYVGCTDGVEGRIYHHLSLCNRGKQPNGMLQRYMVRHTFTAYPTRLAARQGERDAISTEAPLLNKQHNTTRFRKGKGGIYYAIAPVHPLIDEAFEGIPRHTPHSPADSGRPLPSASVGQMSQLTEGVTC